ncbi:unnamed protein product [Staurois parvus]|uniref:Uncharacterized protein n=1 Tax=Staurois parvus TaxID=386267 RepID=A0ABN9GXL2_9NEOB|nr:unnamed protein product [Staurois parvus]
MLSSGIRLRRGIRLSRGFRPVLRRQAHRFGYWQDALQVNAGLQTNGAAGDREELEDGTGEGAVTTEGSFTGLKAG